MSRTFSVVIKIISLLIVLGYVVVRIFPIIGGSIFMIGMGSISDPLSKVHLFMYSAILFTILLVFILYKLFRANEVKRLLGSFVSIVLLVFIYHQAIVLWSNHERDAFELRKVKDLQEREAFLKDHCTKSRNSTSYNCDDGSIR